MKRNDMPCSPGCRSECFIHAEHSGLHLTPNSPRTITHQPKTDTSKTNQRPTERRLQQTLDRNWLCDQWLSLMELSTTWRNSCDTTNILKDWLTSLDLNFTTTISNQNLKHNRTAIVSTTGNAVTHSYLKLLSSQKSPEPLYCDKFLCKLTFLLRYTTGPTNLSPTFPDRRASAGIVDFLVVFMECLHSIKIRA